MGTDDPVILEILRYYFSGKDVNAIEAMLEKTIADHEFLHLWLEYLEPANMSDSLEVFLHESGAYLGQLGYSEIPYVHLLMTAQGKLGDDAITRRTFEPLADQMKDKLDPEGQETVQLILQRYQRMSDGDLLRMPVHYFSDS